MYIKINKIGEKYIFKDKKLNIYHNSYGCSFLYDNIKKLYRVNGKLHNLFGPSVIYSNGDTYYYLNGKKYSHSEWLEQINKKGDIIYVY